MKNQTQLCTSDLSLALQGFVTLQSDLNIYVQYLDNWRLDTGVIRGCNDIATLRVHGSK
jgi:hypothetical protein